MERVEKTSLPLSPPVFCRSQNDEKIGAGGPSPLASSLVAGTTNADDERDASTRVGSGVETDELVSGSALPQNWPGATKWSIVIVMALMSLMVYVQTRIDAPVAPCLPSACL